MANPSNASGDWRSLHGSISGLSLSLAAAVLRVPSATMLTTTGEDCLYPNTPPPRLRAEFVKWLETWTWSRFVTLATNDPMASADRAFWLLKNWDARMNREAVGPQWLKRRDEAIFAFYFLEKSDRNPHWHCLIRFMNFYPNLRDRQTQAIDAKTDGIWKKLCPGGTTDVQVITDQKKVEEYVVKALGDAVSYERFVVPDEFRTPL